MMSLLTDDISCVFEGIGGRGAIYISNLHAAQNPKVLAKFHIKAIVSVLRNNSVRHSKQEVSNHLSVEADDVAHFDLSQYFNETYNFMQGCRAKTNVLVHCYAGISRSATIVIAYLLRKYKYSLSSILSMLKRRRPKINPNKGFLDQLKKYAIINGIPTMKRIFSKLLDQSIIRMLIDQQEEPIIQFKNSKTKNNYKDLTHQTITAQSSYKQCQQKTSHQTKRKRNHLTLCQD